MLAATLIVLGGLAGGLVSGLTGFGTGLTALVFWLQVVPPVIAAPLVVVCSIFGQLQTLPAIWPALDWRRVRPFIAGGLIGVPVGALFLPLVDANLFRLMVGILLICYCGIGLTGSLRLSTAGSGTFADGVVGLGGGFLGGLAGLSGPLPTLWASLKGWGKDEKRAVFQAFNLVILIFALVAQSFNGLLNQEVAKYVLLALPGTFLGVWIGRRIYTRLGNESFDTVVLVILLLAGLVLIFRSLFF